MNPHNTSQPDSPRVSVVLAVHNGEDMVGEAVRSVLEQTLEDFELIAIDDGSTDGTPEVLRSFEDSRMRVVTNPENSGYVTVRNTGLRLARAPLLAVHDHDDLSRADRLQRQVRFLERHPECAAVSSWYRFSAFGRAERLITMPTEDRAIRWRLLFAPAVPHGAMTLRVAAARQAGGYDQRYHHAEDYDLQCRLGRVGRLRNIPEPLMTVRRRAESVSVRESELQRANRLRISRRELARLSGLEEVPAHLQAAAELFLAGRSGSSEVPPEEAVRFGLRVARRFREAHGGADFLSGELSKRLAKHLRFALAHWWSRPQEARRRARYAAALARSDLVGSPVGALAGAAWRSLSRRIRGRAESRRSSAGAGEAK